MAHNNGAQDLRVGTELLIYGRNIYITDCDPFTRRKAMACRVDV